MDSFTIAVLVTIVLGGSLIAAVVACSVWMIRGGAHRRSRLRVSPASHRAAPIQTGLSPFVAISRLSASPTGRRVDLERRSRPRTSRAVASAARPQQHSVPSFLRAFPQEHNTL